MSENNMKKLTRGMDINRDHVTMFGNLHIVIQKLQNLITV